MDLIRNSLMGWFEEMVLFVGALTRRPKSLSEHARSTIGKVEPSAPIATEPSRVPGTA